MAIIPCRECSHQISDLAASCPSCGAPVAQAVQTRPRRRHLTSRILITLMTLWTLGTLVWLFAPRGASDQLTARAKWSLQSFDRGIGHLSSANPTEAPPQAASIPHQSAGGPQPAQSASVLPISSQPEAAPRSVYRSTAEQLYRDYQANVVATQGKIGSSRVQLTGRVAEIDLDATGRPVVKLWADKETTAAMTLAENQRAAAAQLAKGEAVEVECDKVGRTGTSLQGSDCALGVVDSRPKEVNLALFLANERGATRVYVVGPMTEAACQERSAEISSRLQGNRRGEHVVSRNCTDAVRERIPPEGCHPNSSSVSIAGVPTAHLWRYDCNSTAVARASRHRKTSTMPLGGETTLASLAPPAEADGNPAIADDSDSASARPIPAPLAESVAVPGAPATPAPSAASTVASSSAGKTLTVPVATDRASTNNIRLASASNSDTGTAPAVRVPSEESTVAHAAQNLVAPGPAPQQGASAAGTAVISDDLSDVRATDPQAADHIASFCAQTTATTNRDAFIADCRHNEAAAWTRLVQQNEFPTMDDTTRRKCSEPPFPDTYVAKESCARYLLHVQ